MTGTTGGGTFTGNTSGDCITDLYVTNLYGCSPLHIEPSGLNDVYLVENGGNVGIGTSTPSEKLDVVGTNGIFYSKLDDTEVQLQLSAQTTSGVTNISTSSPNAGSLLMGIRGIDNTSSPGFGNQGDSFIYSSIDNNGLNIISQKGFPQTKDDYIRFYAGQLATTGNTPDLYIQGSGSTRGYVGINNDSPTEQLDVSGNTKISEDLFVGDTVYIGNVTGTPITNASLYITQPSILSSIESPIITAEVDDASSTFFIANNSGIDGIFSPRVVGSQKDNNLRPGLFVDGGVLDTLDTTTTPALIFRAIRSDALGSVSEIVNRNLFQWRNLNSTKMTMDVDGNLGIGTSTPSEKLDVVGNTKISEDLFVGDTVYVGNVTGTPTTNASLYVRQPSITGSSESPIIDIQVDDANSYFRINNNSTTDGFFTPTILTRQSDSPDRISLFFDALVEDAQDPPSATADVMRFRARRDSDFIQNRDLFSWYNYTTRLMDMDKDGNLNIIQGGLRINTLGTGTSVNNLGIDSSGNVVSGITGNLLYSQTNNYTLGVPITINHNLNTTDVLVQIVDTNTNELIYGTVDNYQSNSLDVTLSTTINNIKVLVIGSSVSQIVPKGSIVYTLGHDSISPTDNNDYFIGQNFNLTPSTSSNDGRRFIVQKTGTVTQVSIKRTITGTLGSSETNNFYVNNVTQATQGFITSGETFDSSSSLTNYTLSTPLNVTAGDKLEIEWLTPAWVTNPTSVRQVFNMIIEY